MPDPTGMTGAWLDRLARYGQETLTRITNARLDIETGKYDFSRLCQDTLAWSDDLLDLWSPISAGSALPAAVLVIKNDQKQGAMQAPLSVDPPRHGDPVATNIKQLDGKAVFTAAKQIDVDWHDDRRGKLSVGLKNLVPPLANGYYLGAVFVGQALVANIHVRVIDP
jgi:hypothetical protein